MYIVFVNGDPLQVIYETRQAPIESVSDSAIMIGSINLPGGDCAESLPQLWNAYLWLQHGCRAKMRTVATHHKIASIILWFVISVSIKLLLFPPCCGCWGSEDPSWGRTKDASCLLWHIVGVRKCIVMWIATELGYPIYTTSQMIYTYCSALTDVL